MKNFTSTSEGVILLDVNLTHLNLHINQDPGATHTTITYPDGVTVTEDPEGLVRIVQDASPGPRRSMSFSGMSGSIVFNNGVVVNSYVDGGRTVTVIQDNEPDEKRRVMVRCPERSSLVWASQSGGVRVAGLSGKVTVHSTSGDVQLGDCRALQADLTSGDLRAVVSGPTDVRVVSGDVNLRAGEDATGPVLVSVVSGDVFTPGMLHLKPRVSTVSGQWHPY